MQITRRSNSSPQHSPSIQSTGTQSTLLNSNVASASTLSDGAAASLSNSQITPSTSSNLSTSSSTNLNPPSVPISSSTSNKLGLSSIAPPLPPRRSNFKDSGGCLMPNSGSSSSQLSSLLPPPPPVPSHNESSVSHADEDNKSNNAPLAHSRRPKTDFPHPPLHGPLPLPPTEITTGNNFTHFT